MRPALIIPLLSLAVTPAASAAECVPPSSPGFVVAVCEGSAAVSGSTGRLRDVRVTGDGSSATVYVARLDLDGLLMEATLGPKVLPAGVPLHVGLRFDGAVLEREHGADAVSARVRARRAFPSPDTPLSDEAAPRVSDACFAMRRELAPHLVSANLGRQLRAVRRVRARFADRLWAVGTDRTLLEPIVGSLRAGNRRLLEAHRVLRRTGDFARVARPLRAYDRTWKREQRLLRGLHMGECA